MFPTFWHNSSTILTSNSLCMDLSSLHGSSINDHISKDEYTLHYASFDRALAPVVRHGTNALMAKLDIKHAFGLCPVRREDRELLGLKWQNQFYLDLRLPFGLRSLPFLFNRLADAFEWVLNNNYNIQDLMHYLDDYFTVGPANLAVCADNVQTIIIVCLASQLGIPVAPDKLEGPTTGLVFLGILIDTTSMESSLPEDKLSELLASLQFWSTCKRCLKRELLSLIGKLSFGCRIIPAGRIFLRRLINLSTTARLPHHHITMNCKARQDISWWPKFLPSWNGCAIVPDPYWTRTPDLELFMDASGSLGYGIFYMGHWVAAPWPPLLQGRSIQWKELYPIALACHLWGHQWCGKKLLFHCDNQAVVDIWASGTFRDPLIMHLVRSIFFIAATNHFTVLVSHIVGTNNSIADSLSRLQMSWFHQLAPAADASPTPIPESAETLGTSPRIPAVSGNCSIHSMLLLSWCFFAAYLADQVSFKTIKLYMAVIRFATLRTAYQTRFTMYHSSTFCCGELNAVWAILLATAFPSPWLSYRESRVSLQVLLTSCLQTN